MKRLITLCLIVITFSSFIKNEPNTYSGKLNTIQLKFIKDNYPWKDGEFLIINYRQPKRSCHYNNYYKIASSTWFDNLYSKIKLHNISNIFIYADSKRAKKIIDFKKHFEDKNHYLLDNFFSKDKSCYGLMIINEQGDYKQKNGEYFQSDIVSFVNKLL